ncbi:MAG: UvrD-helicase domain-containing protein [Anaerolineales bacterium]|nr:UvrD-helicase domain-containing protein [Anaerolineales bacterium]
MTLLSQYHFKGRQEQAATDPNPAIAVTAGAGSGKTLSLVGRYLHLLEQGYPLRSILAITFTEKAAREMRGRIRKALAYPSPEKDITAKSAENAKENLNNLGVLGGSNIDSARIGTIHSLCAEILRTYPAEAGLDPAFGVLEEGLAAALQAESIDAALAWAASDPGAAALFGDFKEGNLRKILGALLSRRLDVSPLPILGEGAGVRGVFESSLSTYFTACLDSHAWTTALADLTACRSAVPDDKLELARQSVLACWDEVQSARSAGDWDAVLSSLTALRKSISTQGKKDNWDDVDIPRAAMSELRQVYDENLKFLAEKSRFSLDEKIAADLPAIQQLFEQVLAEYQRRKDERQALDFDDLEDLTARLLAENPAVCTRLQSGLRAVLVDEFQDTNDRQRQIVYALTGFNQQSKIENRKSADLFIVGDSKQSIYRFRNADVTVFRQVQADVGAAGGTLIALDLTFRAHKGLLDSLNPLLAPVLGESEDPARPYAVPFAPLRAYRQEPARLEIQPPFVEFHLGLGENAEEGRTAAAQALARRLHQLHAAEGFSWGEMALLFRSSTAYAVYEDAFEQAGIPFITVAGRGFYDRPEIRDLLNILAAVADPADELALVGLLRSPAFALTDAEIYRLRFLEEIPENLSVLSALRGSDLPVHIRACSILDELRTLAGRAPAAAVLKRLLDLTGYRAILASASNGGRMLRNVEKLLADAHRSRLVSLPDFLAYVQTLRDVGLREGEAPADASASGTVQLMTVHKAKGLEFPLTVIADAAYEHRGAGGKVQLAPNGLLLDLKDNDFHPTAWQLASRLEDDRNEAEDARLLYVAATRAKEKLLVSGHVKRKKDGSLTLAGWLGQFPFLGMSAPDDFPLNQDGLTAVFYPVSPVDASNSPQPAPVSTNSPLPQGEGAGVRPDLLAPLTPPTLVSDDKSHLRHADPPQRVWRVVSTAKRPRGPAWVVGRLVHEALRRWHFPAGERGFPDNSFEAFLRPLALETGLTDPAEIHATLGEVRRLLERLRAHPLYAEIDASEHHHEIPYHLPGDSGIIDLLYRTDAGWFLVDFKTDELRSEEEARLVIKREGYDHQVERYAQAIASNLGIQAKTRLVFLNVNNNLSIFDL